MDEVLATVKARPQDEKIYTNYVVEESKGRLLGGKQNESELIDPAPSNITGASGNKMYAAKICGPRENGEGLLFMADRQDSEVFCNVENVREVGASFVSSESQENLGTSQNIRISRGESSMVQISGASSKLEVNVDKMNGSSFDTSSSCDSLLGLTAHCNTSSFKAVDECIQSNSESSENRFNCGAGYPQFLQELFLEEMKALSNFKRVYPPIESDAKHEKYADIEKYIFEEYEKQHRRMTVPLHQCRSSNNEAASSVENLIINNTNNGDRSTARPLDRGDSWISGNPYIRKPPPPPPPKELPFPTQKQIETATRLSQSKTVRHPNLRTTDSCDSGKELADCTNTLSDSASNRKSFVKASIAPINFEFTLLENVSNRNKY